MNNEDGNKYDEEYLLINKMQRERTKDEWMGWMDGRLDGWMDGRTDGRTDGRMKGVGPSSEWVRAGRVLHVNRAARAPQTFPRQTRI